MCENTDENTKSEDTKVSTRYYSMFMKKFHIMLYFNFK